MSSVGEEVIHPPVVERLRIAVRERPVADEELSAIQVRLKTHEDKIVAYTPTATDGYMYDYDYYYPKNSTQDDLFRTIGLEMVDVVLGGLSSNCVTLGLADTGKTHTLFGSPNESGLIQDTVRELFRRLEEQSSSHEYMVSLRYWEMDRDRVEDNLTDDGAPPSGSAKYSVFRDGFDRLYIPGLREVPVQSFDAFEQQLNGGNARRIGRGYERMARWHGFVQLSISTTDKARGERCVLRNMTFVHTKGPDRVGAKGLRGEALRAGSQINVSETLLCAGVIHSLEYRGKRNKAVRSKEDLHRLIRQSQSFFMECRFSQIMSQLLCGHEASFVMGCTDPLAYGETIDTLENLQLFRRVRCACVPIVTSSERGRLLRKLRLLESNYGDQEMLAAMYADSTGRPLSEEEEELLRLRGHIEGWGSADDNKANTKRREEELKQRGRDRLVETAPGVSSTVNFATHGDRNKIYLNPAKTATYEGQWADGQFGGFGEHIQANFKYRGEFHCGQREGEGALFIRASKTAPYVRIYQGEWLGGKRDGRGTQWCKDGEVYEGGFANDQRHGTGKLYRVNGDVIEGNFRGNLVEGWAVLRLPNGDWFEGFWSRGLREGPGVWHYVSRQQLLRGEWSKNTPVMGTIEDIAEKVDNECSGFIPRVGLVEYANMFAKEREKLNDRRQRDFAAKGMTWVDHSATAAATAPSADGYQYTEGDDDAMYAAATGSEGEEDDWGVDIE